MMRRNQWARVAKGAEQMTAQWEEDNKERWVRFADAESQRETASSFLLGALED